VRRFTTTTLTYTLKDALLVILISMDLIPSTSLTPEQLRRLDVNNDGVVDGKDARRILEILYPSAKPVAGSPPPAGSLTLRWGEVDRSAGTQMTLPVTLTRITQGAAGQITFTYNPATLRILEIRQPTTADVSAGIVVDTNTPGRAHVVFVATSEKGTLPLEVIVQANDPTTPILTPELALLYPDGQLVPIKELRIEREERIRTYALSQNYPNPFNSNTTISYDLPEVADVRLTIYDLAGRNIRTLTHGVHQPGHYEIVWDGRDEGGRDVASGMYLYRLEAIRLETLESGFVETRKMLLLR
jgi:hypothetical protein